MNILFVYAEKPNEMRHAHPEDMILSPTYHFCIVVYKPIFSIVL